jgi:ABC-type Mn2+/Zn2+ transport system permease subunit
VEFLTDPGSWWLDPFRDNEFMREALLAALLTIVTTSLVGTWVVLRGLSFFGDALAHGVLPGIAIATIAGFSTTLGAAAAAVVMVLGVNAIRQFSPLPDDTSIGVLFVGFLALAVVVMSSPTASQSGDLDSFLFGSINAIDGADLRRQIVVATATFLGITVLYRALLVTTFDETLARTMGFRPRLVHGVLLVMLAMAIVASFETVGNLLVVAFLIAPPATAALITRRVPVMMATAVLLGSAAAVVGLLVSYHHRTGTGATMALSTVVLFLVVLIGSTLARQLTMRGRMDIHPA